MSKLLHYHDHVIVTPHGAKAIEVYNQPKQWGLKPAVMGPIVVRGFSKVLVRYQTDGKGNPLPKSQQRDAWHDEASVRYV